MRAGFHHGRLHNQFIENIVKFGIGGILSNLAIFFLPIIIFGMAIQINLRLKIALVPTPFVRSLS